MSAKLNILITNGALEDAPDGKIILRGVIDAANLRKLGVGDYQKKTHSVAKLKRLSKAIIEKSRLPDIELGMRGERYSSGVGSSNFVLHDECMIIDGLQRKMALTATALRYPTVNCSVGCIVNFNTTEEWERKRFERLATDRTKVAVQVLLRNWAKDDETARKILELTQDQNCILYNRVTWDQHELAGELIAGSTLYKVIAMLHSWKVPLGPHKAPDLIAAVNDIAEAIGDGVMLTNTRKFFELADFYWGFKNVQKRDGVIQVRAAFLLVMAELIATMPVFWDGSMIKNTPDILKLKPKLQITAKLKDWLAPNKDAKQHVLIYYKRELNKNRSSPFAERQVQTRRPRRAA